MSIKEEQIEIRRIKEDDWTLLKAVRLKALQSDPGVFCSNYNKECEMSEQDWKSWLRGDNCCVFIVFHKKDPIGLTGIAIKKEDLSQSTAVLWGSWLERQYRGKGYSKLLYKERIKWAMSHPFCKKIIVSHRKSNSVSKRSNQRHGFSFTHIKNKVWPDGYEDHECFYELILDKVMKKIVLPPEWSIQDMLWIAWPSHDDDDRWPGDRLKEARSEVAQAIRHIAQDQQVNVLAYGQESILSAREIVGDVANVISAAFGDIWLRDTGPIFAWEEKKLIALRFKTNGWGNKYIYEFDDIIGDTIAQKVNATIKRFNFILEGGAIEHDGNGTILTTKQCVLNSNRNPLWTQEIAESLLKQAFDVNRIVWLEDGLLNDHTDGHIDNIARFIGPNHVLCQYPFGADDPNAHILKSIYKTLKNEGFEVNQIPSPGLVKDYKGDIVPASHMNFIITNNVIVVPIYNTPSQDIAVSQIQNLFPNRKVIGVPSNTLLTGGGSFHCITQQQPAFKECEK